MFSGTFTNQVPAQDNPPRQAIPELQVMALAIMGRDDIALASERGSLVPWAPEQLSDAASCRVVATYCPPDEDLVRTFDFLWESAKYERHIRR